MAEEQRKVNKALTKSIKDLSKRGSDAQVGALNATKETSGDDEAEKKKVSFATPEGAGALRGAIASVRKITKQGSDAVPGRTA